MSYKKDQNITKSIPSFRKMLNLISPNRNSAVVYFEQDFNVEKTQEWIEVQSQKHGVKISMLHVFMTFVGQIMHKHHRLNRYVSGHKFFQRDGVYVSVSAKKKKENGGKIVVLKVPVLKDDSVKDVADRFNDMLNEGRTKENTSQEKEMNFFAMLPGFVLNWFLKLVHFLDRLHWLPKAFVDPDPMFCSIVVANVGSLGIDAGYHHLYEYGNCPFFAMMGKIKEVPAVDHGQVVIQKQMKMKYSFDERIEDGLACAYGLEDLKQWMEDPESFPNQ